VTLDTTRQLARYVPEGRIIVSESGLYTADDLAELARFGARDELRELRLCFVDVDGDGHETRIGVGIGLVKSGQVWSGLVKPRQKKNKNGRCAARAP
jgi:hypothetical protein